MAGNMAPTVQLKAVAVVLTVMILFDIVSSVNNLSYRILEELPPTTVVGNIKTDAGLREEYEPNVLSQLRFGILPPDNDDVRASEYYMIEEVSGILRLASVIDRDHDQLCAFQNTCHMTFDVVISPPIYFRVITVHVEILDVNDNAPEFSRDEYRLNISESSHPGAIYNLPSVFDRDSTDFGIKEFEIHPNSRQFAVTWSQNLQGHVQPRLRLLDQLDREQVETFDVSVVAYDSGSPPNSAALLVHVTVQDMNDNSPEFDLPVYETRIHENTDVGTPVLSIHAEDPDVGSGGTVRYSLSAQTLGEVITKFRIDPVSGVIYLAEAVDREEKQVYGMQVVARDMAKDARQASAAVTVYIDDVNDNAPVIRISVITSSGRAEVSEAADVGTFVALLSVTDRDWGLNSEVICRLSSDRFSMQMMQPHNKFKIVTEKQLDREEQAEYQVSVSCEDKGVPTRSSRETFSVYVTDTNDHRPVFSRTEYEASVIENSAVGMDVIKVQASDADIGENARLKYTLLNDASGRFTIDPDSGMIRTNAKFDYEQSPEVRLEVESRDNGSPALFTTSVVVVHITDINDQAPVFSQLVYTFVVKENQMSANVIGHVSATDKDSGEYSKFYYSLRADTLDSLDFLTIDPDNGTILLRMPLDRELQPSYQLTVVATNTEPPALSGTANITVYVDDVNDNAPIVDFPSRHNNTATISNRLPPGYKVTQISAHDLDTEDNAELSYFIVHNKNESQRFGVDPKSGEVFLNHDVSNVKLETYRVVILVKDSGIPEQSTHANLTIIVNQSVAIHVDGMNPPSNNSQASKNMLIIIIVVAISGVIIIVLLASIVFVLLTSRKKGANESNRAASIIMDAMDTDSNYGNGRRMEDVGKVATQQSTITHNDVTLHVEKDHHRYVSLSNQPSLSLIKDPLDDDRKSPLHAGSGGTPPVPPRGVFVSYHVKSPDVDTTRGTINQTKQTQMPPPIIPRHQTIEEVDTASASSAEDSVTDSGRGGSEEGEEHAPPRPPKQPLMSSFRQQPPEHYNTCTDQSNGHGTSPYYNPGSTSQCVSPRQQPYSQSSYPRHNSHNSGQQHPGSTSPQQTELLLTPDYGLSQLQTEFDPHYRLKYSDTRHGPGYTQSSDVVDRYTPNCDVSNRCAPSCDLVQTSQDCDEDCGVNNQGHHQSLNKQTVRNVKAKDKHKKLDYVSTAITNSSLLNRYRPNPGQQRSTSANNLTGNSFSDSNSLLKYKMQSGSTCSDLTDATSMTSATSGSYIVEHDDDRGLNYPINNLPVSIC